MRLIMVVFLVTIAVVLPIVLPNSSASIVLLVVVSLNVITITAALEFYAIFARKS